MPTSHPTAPLLHRFLGMGLTTLAMVFVVLRYLGDAPFASTDSVTPVIAYTFAGFAFALLAVTLLLLKPRVPDRRTSQSIEEYWATPDVTAKVFLVWFLTKGAGVMSAVGYFLTGAPVSAMAMALAIVVFWWDGPSTFAK